MLHENSTWKMCFPFLLSTLTLRMNDTNKWLAPTFDWPDVLTKVLTVSHTPHSETTLNTTNGWRTDALKNQSGTEQGCQKERGRSANDIVGHENTGQRWFGNLKHFLTFVVVNIQVVWCWEDGDEGGESSGLTFAVHPVASDEKERACCCYVSPFTWEHENVCLVRKTYPASCASCARMIDNRLLLWRNSHTAG